MTSLSFNMFKNLYNETRSFDVACFNNAISFLSAYLSKHNYNNCIEPGIGNGRIARYIKEQGYDVTGIDISSEMLIDLSKNTEGIKIALSDATVLPFKNCIFDFAIAVHLFYFIKHWQVAVDELIRVTKANGAIILMHTGFGQEVPELNSRYKEICRSMGYSIENIGVKSTSEVIDYLMRYGFLIKMVKDKWNWVENIQLSKAVEYIHRRAYSFTGKTPEKCHEKAIETMKKELCQKYGTLEKTISVSNQIQLTIIQKLMQ